LAALSVPRSAEMWAGILDNKEAAVFVAESSAAAPAAIVGIASCASAQSKVLGATGEVTGLFVLDTFKRRGIGRTLVWRSLDALSMAGHRSAGAWVLRNNRDACLFYEAMGGRPAV